MFSIWKLYLVFLLMKLHSGQEDSTNFQTNYFSSRDLSELMHLRDFLCGFSPNQFNATTYDPWFCARPQDCAKTHKVTLTKKEEGCDTRFHREGRDECCYMGNMLKNNLKMFTNDPLFWGLTDFKKESIQEYWLNLYNKTVHNYLKEILPKEKVCGIEPTGFDAKNNTLYTPYICVEWDCSKFAPNGLISKLHSLKLNESWSEGRIFCKKNFEFGLPSEKGYCCHPSVLVQNLKPDDFQENNFKTKVMHIDQQYAPGFRSSIQCENYAKSVCEGKKDKCPLRVLDRSKAIPGEFPHHVLIGTQGSLLQLFHCSGSLVSRYYVLTAILCHYYDRIPASVALLGEYNFHEVKEFGQNEMLTYISEVIEEPKSDDNIHQYWQAKLMVMKLWRPVTFNRYIRPACINWRNYFKAGSTPDTIIFPKIAIFTGYGMNSTLGRWSNTVKHYSFIPDTCANPNRTNNLAACQKCQDAFYHTKNNPGSQLKDFDSFDTFCITNHTKSTSRNWAPCQFDLGGPANVYDNSTPYCQWKILGVHVNPKVDCSFDGPALFRVAGGYMLGWLEDAIWKHDFYLFEVDLRYPTCYNSHEQTFDNMLHLSKDMDNKYID